MSSQAAFAKGTYKNLRIQWKAYFLFCYFFNLTPVPTNIQTLVWYAQFLSRSMKSSASVKNYIHSLKTLHLFLGTQCPDLSEFHLKLVLKGIARSNPHCTHQAWPITPSILLEFYSLFDFTTAEDTTFWCLFIFAFFLMCRKSNLVPDTIKSFDVQKQLCRKNITLADGMIIIKMKWSKTIQFGERELSIPLVEIPGSKLCPVKAYMNMIKLTRVPEEYAAFCLKRERIVPVTYQQMQNVLKKLIEATGRDSKLYSSHSFRRGGASWAFSCKVPSELIQLFGDWRSDAYKQYLKFTLNDKISVAAKMRDNILEHETNFEI